MLDRRVQIVKALTENDELSVADMAIMFKVSQVTIRNDLKVLQNDGLIRRRHGGAVPMSDESIANRLNINYGLKLKIADEAAELVKSGETVLIESGSTNAILAKKLCETKEVTIVTNSYFIASFVKDIPKANIILLGGNFQTESEVCTGPLTRQALSSFHVDKLFIGTDGYSPSEGFTCMDLDRADVVAAMSKRADKSIILTDSSKFYQRGVATQISLRDTSMVITDDNLTDEIMEDLRSNKIEVKTVTG